MFMESYKPSFWPSGNRVCLYRKASRNPGGFFYFSPEDETTQLGGRDMRLKDVLGVVQTMILA